MASVDNKNVRPGVGQVHVDRTEEIRPESGQQAKVEKPELDAPDTTRAPLGEQLPAGTSVGESSQLQIRADAQPQRRLGKRQKNLRTEQLARLSPQERRAFGAVKNVLDQGSEAVRRRSEES